MAALALRACHANERHDLGRRLRAAEPEYRDAELPRLVGEVVLDTGARADHDTDRQGLEHRVVSLERHRLGVPSCNKFFMSCDPKFFEPLNPTYLMLSI